MDHYSPVRNGEAFRLQQASVATSLTARAIWLRSSSGEKPSCRAAEGCGLVQRAAGLPSRIHAGLVKHSRYSEQSTTPDHANLCSAEKALLRCSSRPTSWVANQGPGSDAKMAEVQGY